LQKVEAQYEALAAQYEAADEVPADVTEKLDRFTAEIDSTYAFDPDDVARGGVFISLSREGEACIERGFIRRHDEKQPEADEASVEVAEARPEDGASAEAEETEAEGPLSDKLIADLTAHRSAALEDALAQHPDVAFAALVHALALAAFYPTEQASCLQIKGSEAWLANHARGIDDTPALKAVGERHAQWARQLPREAGGLWEFVVGLDYDSRMALMAHCVAITVNAVRLPHERRPGVLAHANALVVAVNLEMTAYWTPTVDSYFGRVTKSRILDAVREGVSPEAAERIAGMKKQAMAETAAQLVAGRGWLPDVLRMPVHEAAVPAETEAQEASMAA
jgi:ParB family transcriptional regulator, chromosome partitioning protein